MVDEAETTIHQYGGNRHTLYLRLDLIEDSAFPFDPGQPLTIKIDGDRLIIEAQP